MITRIEIDGFKSFIDFSVDLKPFQILIGANGVGKSNLFDAIMLLSELARGATLYEALRKNRGDIWDLFTQYPNGERAPQMTFAVEMLIDKTVTDDFGVEAEVSSNRLRYEVQIAREVDNHIGRLNVTHERLIALSEDHDKWYKIIPAKHRREWILRGRRSPYISTDPEKGVISKHQDGRSGNKLDVPLGRIERTLLSATITVEYPTAYAVRQEMQNWRFFQFNPAALRKASSIFALQTLLTDGSNLAAVLQRMAEQDEVLLGAVSSDIANIVSGIHRIEVETLKERQEYMVYAKTTEGTLFPSTVLSDGTLRVLALTALKNDPLHYGLLCFEEPENGVYPSRLHNIVALFQELSTQFDRDGDIGQKLRQVIINTHSPKLLSYAPTHVFLYVYPTRKHNHPRLTRISRISEKLFEEEPESEAQKVYTKTQVIEYLDFVEQREKLESLETLDAGRL